MPGVYVGVDKTRADLFLRIQSPQGKEYTCAPSNVYDEKTGYTLLLHRRGEQLIQKGYDIALRSSGALRVFDKARHGDGGGYLLRHIGGKLTCCCPSARDSADGLCKHIMGCASLCYAKASQCDNLGKPRHAQTWRTIADRLLSPDYALPAGPPDAAAPLPNAALDDYAGQDCAYCGLPAFQYNGDGDLVCRSCSRA